ncbi:hypothetical protein SAMN05216315_11149 [Nitrosospira sp. Nsp18]|nr:hypothetical protein SAMN05216315_11149 [Nitrosospira sp. Nsp18]
MHAGPWRSTLTDLMLSYTLARLNISRPLSSSRPCREDVCDLNVMTSVIETNHPCQANRQASKQAERGYRTSPCVIKGSG